MLVVCNRRAGYVVWSKIHAADCALLGHPPADAVSCAGNTPNSVLPHAFMKAKSVEERGFSHEGMQGRRMDPSSTG